MRGKLVFVPYDLYRFLIIPAHAVQTPQFGNGAWVETDHPRACGANLYKEVYMKYPHGSSPRMRGKPAKLTQRARLSRIIPAHAGQTANIVSK